VKLKSWRRGVGFLSGWTDAAHDDLLTLRPLESATVKPEYIPGQGVLYHVRRGAFGETPIEWDVSVAHTTATVNVSTVAWGSILIAPPLATVDLSAMGADDERWIYYLQIQFEAGPDSAATLGLTADANKATGDPNNGIVRINLARVKRFTADGPVLVTMKRRVDVDMTGAAPL